MKSDLQPWTEWDILLWDIELQETKLLGIVDAASAYLAIEKAIWLFHMESAEQRERLLAVRRPLSAISRNCNRGDEPQG
jgi:hypothetical protein